MNKITLVVTARYTSNIDVITGFRDLQHAQQTMLDMVNAEANEPYAELEDNESTDTATNSYYITESRDVNGRTDDQISEDAFYTSLIAIADDYYNTHTGNGLSYETRKYVCNLGIRSLDDLYDNEAEFDNTREFDAFEHALETLEEMERV